MSQDQGAPTPQPRALPAAPSYDVGYRKPPVQTRFKPGQSGNPKGHPKPQASLAQSLLKALLRKVKITENGEVKSIHRSRNRAKVRSQGLPPVAKPPLQ